MFLRTTRLVFVRRGIVSLLHTPARTSGFLGIVLLGSLLLHATAAVADEMAYCRLDSERWLGCSSKEERIGASCRCPTADRVEPNVSGHIFPTVDEDIFPISSETVKVALGLTGLSGPIMVFVPKNLSAQRNQARTAEQQHLLQIYDYFNFINLVPAAPAHAPNSSPRLTPARAFLPAKDIPPPNLGGYGVVALKAKATPASKERLEMLCQSFLATLPPQQSLPASIPTNQQMITIWPIDDPQAVRPGYEDCELLLDHYDLYGGQSAIADAIAQGNNLSGRGPFLIGWAPSNSRYIPDAVVLVVDMSQFDTQVSFDDAMPFWQKKIVKNPELWKSGFSIELIRLAIRDFVDHYGAGILDGLKFGR
jgi:hypothetical protein